MDERTTENSTQSALRHPGQVAGLYGF
jgi:hypothetical protein